MRKSLPNRFEAYKQALTDAEEMLKKFKDRFKAKLLQQSEEYKRNVAELVNEFKTKGPFSSELRPEEVSLIKPRNPNPNPNPNPNLNPNYLRIHFIHHMIKALSLIDQMKAKMAKLKEEEQELRRGLAIFRIDHPFSKDIQNLEKVKLLKNLPILICIMF